MTLDNLSRRLFCQLAYASKIINFNVSGHIFEKELKCKRDEYTLSKVKA